MTNQTISSRHIDIISTRQLDPLHYRFEISQDFRNMDVFKCGNVTVTFNRRMQRFGFIENDSFVSATITTFKIILKLLGMKEHLSIFIKQDSSAVDMLCNAEGASLMFLNSKSKMNRSRVVLDAEFIVSFILHEEPILAMIEDPSYSTSDGEQRGLKRTLDEAEQEFSPQPTYEITDTPDRGFYNSTKFDFSTSMGEDVPEGPSRKF